MKIKILLCLLLIINNASASEFIFKIKKDYYKSDKVEYSEWTGNIHKETGTIYDPNGYDINGLGIEQCSNGLGADGWSAFFDVRLLKDEQPVCSSDPSLNTNNYQYALFGITGQGSFAYIDVSKEVYERNYYDYAGYRFYYKSVEENGFDKQICFESENFEVEKTVFTGTLCRKSIKP